MLIDFDEFRQRLKQLNLPVYRDLAPKKTKLPYWVYTFAGDGKISAGGRHVDYVNEYQVSLFTHGTENELSDFRRCFADVPYSRFGISQGDENDVTVNNFYTYVTVRANG